MRTIYLWAERDRKGIADNRTSQTMHILITYSDGMLYWLYENSFQRSSSIRMTRGARMYSVRLVVEVFIMGRPFGGQTGDTVISIYYVHRSLTFDVFFL